MKTFLHVDGDAFFVSCELTKRPDLKGKPVVTGSERGIVSALSYEAKAAGITRAMRMVDAKLVCPSLVMIHSDFSLYAEYSRRMVTIIRRYASHVETYSIDECFADVSELDHRLGMTPESVAARIKQDLEQELGITFSVGLGPTKTLAKIASGFQKPSGLTIVTYKNYKNFLLQVPIAQVWGIGRRTSQKMEAFKIRTASDLIAKESFWVKQYFSKPVQEIYLELQAVSLRPVRDRGSGTALSISRTKSFKKSLTDESLVFAQLSHNVELACRELRRQRQFSKKVSLFLKTQQFTYEMAEFELPYGISTAHEIMKYVRKHFHTLFRKGVSYRATGITVSHMVPFKESSLGLFENYYPETKSSAFAETLDAINHRFGSHSLYLASSTHAVKQYTKGFTRKLSLPVLGFVT